MSSQGSEGGTSPSASLIDQLKGMLRGDGGGGLSGLLDKLDAGGLADKLKSWIGMGDNDPVDGDEIENALGKDTVQDMANKAGCSVDDAKSQLAKAVPEVIDKVTPEGKTPEPGDVGGLVDKLNVKTLGGNS